MKRPLVFVCSPWRAKTEAEQRRNLQYLKDILADSIYRGEAPFAPHAIYPLVLREDTGRETGIACGNSFLVVCSKLAVYQDLGFSKGMDAEMLLALRLGIPIEHRRLPDWNSSSKQA